MSNVSVIREVCEDCEFFTVVETGESGMSGSGFARWINVPQRTVSSVVKKIQVSVSDTDLPESLKRLHGKTLTLSDKLLNRGAIVYNDATISALTEYFAFDAKKKSEKALHRARLMMNVGARAMIHQITGWKPAVQASHFYLEALIVEEPRIWEEHFDSEWRSEAMRLTGWQWNYRVMSKFINETVYSYLPKEVRDRLDEVNPKNESGRRVNKQHQHFEESADIGVLVAHIKTVKDLMTASVNRVQFDALMKARFQGVYQIEMWHQPKLKPSLTVVS